MQKVRGCIHGWNLISEGRFLCTVADIHGDIGTVYLEIDFSRMG
jgi:hypothetical protein